MRRKGDTRGVNALLLCYVIVVTAVRKTRAYTTMSSSSSGRTRALRLAIVMPHIPGDEEKIRHTLTTETPCVEDNNGSYSNEVVVDLLLYSTKPSFDPTRIDEEIPSSLRRCVRSVHVLRHALPDHQDQYIHAPPLMWYELVRGSSSEIGTFMRAKYDYMFLMEPDVRP